MKQSFIKGIKKNVLLITALIAFVIFTGNRNPDPKNVAGRCVTGYSIPMAALQKFMLDSLHGNQFEGGVYSKANLLAAINETPGDSVYLINILKNCNVGLGTDLALTSPQAPGVAFVAKPSCYPCPGKACCPARVCATRIDRGCVNYQVFNGLTNNGGSPTVMADE